MNARRSRIQSHQGGKAHIFVVQAGRRSEEMETKQEFHGNVHRMNLST